jgi:hypothetical protein
MASIMGLPDLLTPTSSPTEFVPTTMADIMGLP